MKHTYRIYAVLSNTGHAISFEMADVEVSDAQTVLDALRSNVQDIICVYHDHYIRPSEVAYFQMYEVP